MADRRAQLLARIEDELATTTSDAAGALGEAIRARHGKGVAGILLHGSRLRRRAADGVHDFFVVVDDYRSAYASWSLAFANAVLPPNEFRLENCDGGDALRARYAVISCSDLARACAGRAHRAGLWARFAQPMAFTWVRGPRDYATVAESCTEAICTAVRSGLAAEGHSWQEIESGPFWCELFRATYAAEQRPAHDAAIDAIYAENRARFDAVLDLALGALRESGAIERGSDPWRCRVRLRRTDVRRVGATARTLFSLQRGKRKLTLGHWSRAEH